MMVMRRGGVIGVLPALAPLVVWALAGVLLPRAAAADDSTEPPFWERVTSPGRERFERLFEQADGLLSSNDLLGPHALGRRLTQPEKLAQSEALLHEALALRPDDFRALLLLAEVQSIADRPAAAVSTLERALPRAQLPSQEAICWFRLGVERSKLGQYAEAVTDYDREVAFGDADGTAYANSAEILMTLGRLQEAADRYREAIRVDEQAPDRRAREHSLTLSYYGLGVTLDRDEQPVAAREMMARALAFDPNLSQLTAAQQPGSDVFFIPEGDVYYYLGLASEVAGRPDDAEAGFREFVARLPKSPWARRAQTHIDALAPAAVAGAAGGRGARPGGRGAALRVIAAGTVLATGGLPAPLIDAAWRERPQLLDACLDAASAAAHLGTPDVRTSVRLALEMEIDARGAVTRVVAKAPAPLDAAFARCAEAAIKDGLRVSPTGRSRTTRARLELVVANGEPAGL
jgi:tetratricopeptide (TPR) repeat protein